MAAAQRFFFSRAAKGPEYYFMKQQASPHIVEAEQAANTAEMR
jgi:hypothetical protein